jgi:tetratricopeptide (TPR) repeat protein
LNPNDDHIIHALGYVLAYSGTSPEAGIELLKEIQQRNPYYPEVIQRDLAQAHFFAHRYEDGLAALNQVARRHRPSYWLYKAANHGQLGQLEEARAAIDEGLRLKPDLNLEHAIERRLKMGLSPENAELLREALRTAGLPERAPAGSHESDPWPLPAEPFGAGVLEKSGSHLSFGGKSIGQGRDKARDAVIADPALYEALRRATVAALPSKERRVGERQAA